MPAHDSRFERIGSETLYEGKLVTSAWTTLPPRGRRGGRRGRSSSTRAPSASSCTTASGIYLVRQPREAIGEPDLLELPAGKLDVEGEAPLEPPSAS